MQIYNYIALKNNKDIVKGKVEGNSLREARENIRKLGFLPTKIVEEGSSNTENKESVIVPKKMQRLSLQEKIDFTSTLQILAQSGIPIIESLVFIENDAAKPRIRLVANEMRRQIMAGATFAETIAKYPHIFGHIYIGLVKAGEASGELEKVLDRLLELLRKEGAIKSKVVGTLMYPAFVILMAMFVVTIMLVFVFPAFKGMFASTGTKLPFITALLMGFGTFLQHYWILIPLIFGTVIFGTIFLVRWEKSRRIIDKYDLKIPLLSDLIQYSNFSNFVAVMQVAYEAGVPIVDCLYLSNITLTNYTLQDKISKATINVQQGQHLSVALKSTAIIPKMILFMIATGEQSGRLGEMLTQATVFIDKKLDTIIDAMTKMVEPLMLLVIGSIVLILALALYMPLFQSYTLS